jgi:hypothetical protein
MESVAELESIPGWYAFRPFYERAVATAPPGATLVEVGVFCGRSLADLARMARDSGKNLRVVGVDNFRGSPEFDGMVMWEGRPFGEAPAGALVFECFTQLKAAGVLGGVSLLVADSARAAGFFADGSVHAVMLDAAHDESSVAADIAAWRGKVAPGGWLAGDDLDVPGFPGVRAAVESAFPAFDRDGATWSARRGVQF